MADLESLAASVKERFPKVWAMISDVSGSTFISRSLHKYLKLSLGTEAEDDASALRMVLEKLESRGSSVSRGRWRILRSALLPGSDSNQASEAASVRTALELNLIARRACGVLHGWSPLTAVAVVHDTDNVEEVLLPVAGALAGTGGQQPACCLVWTCISARLVENWLASRLDRSIEVNACFGAVISPRQAGERRRSYALAEFRSCDYTAPPGWRPLVLNQYTLRRSVEGGEAECCSGSDPAVFTVQPQPVAPSLDQLVAHRSGAGVDNTGNVCVWPCEEVMAYMCTSSPAFSVAGKRVLELGAGLTGETWRTRLASGCNHAINVCVFELPGLAGLFCAAVGGAHEVVITDGNEQVVVRPIMLPSFSSAFFWLVFVNVSSQAAQNVSLCLDFNRSMQILAPDCLVSAACYPWAALDQSSPWFHRFDVLLCADCLFFEDFHDHLLAVCATALKPVPESKVRSPSCVVFPRGQWPY
jgi:hypothetical protein